MSASTNGISIVLMSLKLSSKTGRGSQSCLSSIHNPSKRGWRPRNSSAKVVSNNDYFIAYNYMLDEEKISFDRTFYDSYSTEKPNSLVLINNYHNERYLEVFDVVPLTVGAIVGIVIGSVAVCIICHFFKDKGGD